MIEDNNSLRLLDFWFLTGITGLSAGLGSEGGETDDIAGGEDNDGAGEGEGVDDGEGDGEGEDNGGEDGGSSDGTIAGGNKGNSAGAFICSNFRHFTSLDHATFLWSQT